MSSGRQAVETRRSDENRALRALLDRAAADDATPGEVEAARRRVDALFAAEQDRIYWVCLRYMGDPERAADLAQDTFLTAYRQLADFRGEGSFYAWLYGIARYKCMRARRKKAELLSEDGVLEPAAPGLGTLSHLRRHERDALLLEAAQAVLEPAEQEAVYLRYVQELGIPEITELLELTDKSGARGLLQRCKRKLGRELQRRLAELGHGPSLIFGSIA